MITLGLATCSSIPHLPPAHPHPVSGLSGLRRRGQDVRSAGKITGHPRGPLRDQPSGRHRNADKSGHSGQTTRTVDPKWPGSWTTSGCFYAPSKRTNTLRACHSRGNTFPHLLEKYAGAWVDSCVGSLTRDRRLYLSWSGVSLGSV